MTKVNNFFEPFLVPLPGPSRSGYFDENQRLQEDLLQRQRETMRRQQLQQYAAIQLQQQNSGWGSMSPITTPMSPMSHWAQPQPMSSIGQGPFEFGGPGGLSSGLSGSQISLNHINNDVWQPRAPGSIPHTPKRVPSVSELNFPQAEVLVSKRSILSELEDSESSIIKSSKELLMTDDELMVSQPSPVVSSAIQPPFKSPVNKVNSVELPVEPVEPVVPESALATEPTLIKKPKAKSGKKSSPVSEQPTPVVSKATPDVCKVEKPVEEVAEILEAVTVKEEPVSALAKSPKAAAPVLAPWAKKEPIKAKAPSIKEIQEMEAAELKTRKAQQQQQQQQLAASIIQASRSSTPSNAPALPSGATWATVGVASATPKKTLAQIQKEEEEAARKRGPSVASTNVKKYADLAASGSSSFRVASSSTVASTTTSTASSVATSGGAWTTVGPGGKKVGSGAATAPTAASVISAAPAVKKVETPARSVSAINTNKISAASEDFLNWCKSSLQDLHSGVNHTELLSMLFSLPASSESKEIIAETIYSSSTTMDGRRFAEEFIKRRKSVDTEISSSTSWSDILQKSQTTPKPVNDGWNVSFKVVGKKKGRKE